MQLSFQIRIPL